ncbi:MAG: hypothetical protein GDA52_07770 [Rhodobacteraceae bacterium]|nr:hypothetical protein [Paracoccaceae bacterium]
MQHVRLARLDVGAAPGKEDAKCSGGIAAMMAEEDGLNRARVAGGLAVYENLWAGR